MPWLCTMQRTFRPDGANSDESVQEEIIEQTEQQARQWVFQQFQDAFSQHAGTQSIQCEITKF